MFTISVNVWLKCSSNDLGGEMILYYMSELNPTVCKFPNVNVYLSNKYWPATWASSILLYASFRMYIKSRQSLRMVNLHCHRGWEEPIQESVHAPS
jgi:hypothetical protein